MGLDRVTFPQTASRLGEHRAAASARPTRTPSWSVLVLLFLVTVPGCAAFRPIHGVPARYVPDEFRAVSRSGKQTIDLSLLRQSPPAAYRLDRNDLLSIYIEGVLGKLTEQPPVYFPPNNDVPPTVGFPIPVRDDGTISLPLVGAVSVRGQTIREVEETLRKAYTVDKSFLVAGRDRIFVALQRPRTHRILVIRQEASSDVSVSQGGTLNIGALKRGTGKVVHLPAYKNDVLNALAETGGLPGLDAENAIYVIRSRQSAGGYSPLPPGATPAWPGVSQQQPIIRGQSPESRFDPQGDYRRAVITPTAGWTSPSSAVLPAQYTSPEPIMNLSAAPMTPNLASPTPVPAQPMIAPTPMPIPAIGGFAPRPSPSALPPSTFPAPALPPSPQLGAMPSTPPVTYPVPGSAQTLPQQAWPPQVDPGTYPPYQDSMPYPSADPSMNLGSGWPPGMGFDPREVGDSLQGRTVIRIPVRLGPGEVTDIRESDIILNDGDIVFIESRETEVFYTGGLLGGGQYTLPRDYDLDVLGAIAIAQGQRSGGGGTQATQSAGGQSALNGDVSISASQLIILRPLPDGQQLTIQVNLYAALRDPTERIIVKPGDYLLLQYTRMEAVAAFVERHLLAGALFSVAAAQLNTGGN